MRFRSKLTSLRRGIFKILPAAVTPGDRVLMISNLQVDWTDESSRSFLTGMHHGSGKTMSPAGHWCVRITPAGLLQATLSVVRGKGPFLDQRP